MYAIKIEHNFTGCSLSVLIFLKYESLIFKEIHLRDFIRWQISVCNEQLTARFL